MPSLLSSELTAVLRAADAEAWAARIASPELFPTIPTAARGALQAVLDVAIGGQLITGHASVDRALLALALSITEADATEARAALRHLLPESEPSPEEVAPLLYPGIRSLLQQITAASDRPAALAAARRADAALSVLTSLTLWCPDPFRLPEDLGAAAFAADDPDGLWPLLELYHPT
jgi:hypothetical protein